MNPLEDELNTLYPLIDQEILAYDQLIEEMTRESEYLRQGSTESLMKTVKGIEHYVEKILGIESSVQKTIAKILNTLGRGEMGQTLTNILSLLPQHYRPKVEAYRKKLVRQKDWIRQINEGNKSFIQEYLGILKELTSSLIQPAIESPGYLRTGHQRALSCLPYALNREV